MIRRELLQAGFELPSRVPSQQDVETEHDIDDDLVLVQRFLRGFLRANALNESTVRQRLGVKANHFFKELLPRLEGAAVIKAVSYQGHGTQQRMRLVAPMTRIEAAMSAADGDFNRFVREVRQHT